VGQFKHRSGGYCASSSEVTTISFQLGQTFGIDLKMKPTSILLAIAALFAAGEACKCWQGSNFNIIDSRTCCERASGKWDGRDCPDRSLPNPATTFNNCCRQHSSSTDC